MSQAQEPAVYNWQHLGFCWVRRTIGLVISMGFMLLLIFVAYNIQFSMEKSVAQLDNYE